MNVCVMHAYTCASGCLCVHKATCTCVCLCVSVCKCVTWGHVSAFCLHLLSPPLLMLLFFFVSEERSVAPVRVASIHRLSFTFFPLPSLLCFSLSLCTFFLFSFFSFLLFLLCLFSLLLTLSAPSQRAEDASLGVLSSH